jgi:hypothetical protein
MKNKMYMYEDSRLFGVSYLFAIGIPSAISAGKHDGTHNSYWMGKRANRQAARYFGKYYGVEWNYANDYPLN